MYTQDVVCPKCAQITKVNVIETEGAIVTPCGKCGIPIHVTVASNGQVAAVQYISPPSPQVTGCAIIPFAVLTSAVAALFRHFF